MQTSFSVSHSTVTSRGETYEVLTAKAQCEKRKVDQDGIPQSLEGVEGGGDGFEINQAPAIPDGIVDWDDGLNDQGGGDRGAGSSTGDSAIDPALLVVSDVTRAEGQRVALTMPDALIDPALLAISDKMLGRSLVAEGRIASSKPMDPNTNQLAPQNNLPPIQSVASTPPTTNAASSPANVPGIMNPAVAPQTHNYTLAADATVAAVHVVDGDGLVNLGADNLDAGLTCSGALLDALRYLQGKGWGSEWVKCIGAFVEFEKAHGFPVSPFLE
jgi:hypothetical protein